MMELGKLKEIIMSDRVFVISVLIGVITLICSVTFYKYNELHALRSNIESAIVKGIDPVAVRCAYSDQRDIVCVAYAAGLQSPNLSKSGK
jgi:hypothetical protein